jgi:hypothetical protein
MHNFKSNHNDWEKNCKDLLVYISLFLARLLIFFHQLLHDLLFWKPLVIQISKALLHPVFLSRVSGVFKLFKKILIITMCVKVRK